MVALIAADPRLLPGGGQWRPPVLALPRRTLRARDQCATLVRAGAVRMNRQLLVGWAKALARPCCRLQPLVRCAHAFLLLRFVTRGHGARADLLRVMAVPAPLPTL